jgi:hypothetical protein
MVTSVTEGGTQILHKRFKIVETYWHKVTDKCSSQHFHRHKPLNCETILPVCRPILLPCPFVRHVHRNWLVACTLDAPSPMGYHISTNHLVPQSRKTRDIFLSIWQVWFWTTGKQSDLTKNKMNFNTEAFFISWFTGPPTLTKSIIYHSTYVKNISMNLYEETVTFRS